MFVRTVNCNCMACSCIIMILICKSIQEGHEPQNSFLSTIARVSISHIKQVNSLQQNCALMVSDIHN